MKIIKNLQGALSITLCFVLLTCLVFGSFCTVKADSIDGEETSSTDDSTIVTLGADLSSKERATVLELLGLTENDLKTCTVLTVTNQDEHTYLDNYLSNDVIGRRALSSIKLVKTASGNGINVETDNISYCTESMYVNALATAGVEDADVTVVGPFSISGTAALVGVMKAYEKISGEKISDDVKDAATDELVTTGEVGTSINDSEKASELIGYVKNQVVSKGITSPDKIRKVVTDAAEEMNIPLKDEDVDNIVSTMSKISKLDLNPSTLKQQAKQIYDKLDGLNIHIDKEQAKGFLNKIAAFFKKVYNKLIELFS